MNWLLLIAICKYHWAWLRYRLGFREARLRFSRAEFHVFFDYAAFVGGRDLIIWLQNYAKYLPNS